MTPAINRLPALPIAIGMIAGILLWTIGCQGWIAIAATIVATAVFLRGYHYVAIGIAAIAVGWLCAFVHRPTPAPEGIFDGRERLFSTTIEEISTRANSQQIVLTVDSVSVNETMHACNPFRISVVSMPDWTLEVGERLKINAVLEPPDVFGDFPGDRDMQLYNLRKSIVGQIFLEDGNMVREGFDTSIGRWFYTCRQRLLHILAHSELSPQAMAVAAALTVGNSDDLDESVRENFRAAGVAHALALSGFHVGIIVMLIAAGLFPLRAFYRLRRLRLVLTILAIWFYAALTGMPDSVVRAAVMLSIIIMAKLFGHDSYSPNSLCAAIAIILAFSPVSLFSVGFWLSVGAVIGILAFAPKLNPFDPSRWRAHRLTMLVVVPIAAVAGTIPVTVAAFHRLPLLFIVSNFCISMLLPLLMFCAVGIIIAGFMGAKALLLCKACNALVWLTEHMLDRLANSSISEINDIYLTMPAIAAIAVAIVATMLMANLPPRRSLILTCGAVYIACIITIVTDRSPVAHNEAFIIRQSGNTPIVVRNGNRITAIFTCHPRRIENATRVFNNRIAPYATITQTDSIIIRHADDMENPVTLNGCRMALFTSKSTAPTLSAQPIDYALVTSRYTGDISLLDSLRPKAIIISRDVSIKLAEEIKRKTKTQVIDLRYEKFSF